MTVIILAALLVLAACGVIAMAAMCWVRAHDGTMSTKAGIKDDIRSEGF
jgi:hypothetical protein